MSEIRRPIIFSLDLDQTTHGIEDQVLKYQELLPPQYLAGAQKEIDAWIQAEKDLTAGRSRRTFTKKETSSPSEVKGVYFLGNKDLFIPDSDFQPVRDQIRNDTRLLVDAKMIPGANSGVKTLIGESPFGGYRTVRPDKPKVLAVTKEKLRKDEFPYPEKVTIYDDPEAKLLSILKEASQNSGLYVLVDDGLKGIADAAEKFANGPLQDVLRKQFVLAAFGVHPSEMAELQDVVGGRIYGSSGVQTKTLESGLTVATLPSWSTENVSGIIEYMNQRSSQR